MSLLFEELDYRPTPIGAISLRRRHDPRLGAEVYEIKLGDEFLMSSHFTASEIALAHLALADLEADRDAAVAVRPGFDVVVGGLGLGYTARAVLEHASVASLLVVEYLDAVIDWHQTGLVPLGETLTRDPRCRFMHADFFAAAASPEGFDPLAGGGPARRFDAILLDIDHSPDALLATGNAAFYTEPGLARLAVHLRPGGVFALWSNDQPDAAFTARLASVFTTARAEPVTFFNPLQNRAATQTVYIARTAVV